MKSSREPRRPGAANRSINPVRFDCSEAVLLNARIVGAQKLARVDEDLLLRPSRGEAPNET